MPAAIANFFAYLASALVLIGAFLGLYTLILPMKEWDLIKQGNASAALVIGAALVGFSLPLAEAIKRTQTLSQMIVWSAIALAVQLLGFGLLRLVRKDAALAIEKGDMAEAILLAAGNISLGLVTAACLS